MFYCLGFKLFLGRKLSFYKVVAKIECDFKRLEGGFRGCDALQSCLEA